jgi:lipoate-protein ligase A
MEFDTPSLKDWRFMISKEVNPYRNMAREEAVFLSVESFTSPNTFRFWMNDRSVILGTSQKPEEELNLDVCSKHCIDIVRRFTGGGAVYTDLGNLNWSIMLNKKALPLATRGINKIFEGMSQPIILTLRDLGVKAEFKAPNAIFLYDKKISGLAMYLKRNSILCHGTLLVESDLNLLKTVLKKLKDPVININDLDTKITKNDIINKLKEILPEVFNINLNRGCVTDDEKNIVKKLGLNRYKYNTVHHS